MPPFHSGVAFLQNRNLFFFQVLKQFNVIKLAFLTFIVRKFHPGLKKYINSEHGEACVFLMFSGQVIINNCSLNEVVQPFCLLSCNSLIFISFPGLLWTVTRNTVKKLLQMSYRKPDIQVLLYTVTEEN